MVSFACAFFSFFTQLTIILSSTYLQGLGKTVEAIAGAILYNELAATKGDEKRPTAIVSPNDAVLLQWRDTLIANGVSADRIFVFKKASTEGFDDANFILMTRYSIQSEVRELFKYLAMPDNERPRSKSALFRSTSVLMLKKLRYQYLAKSGQLRVKNIYKRKGELVDGCVTRLVSESSKKIKDPVFGLLVTDEAHLLKNIGAYWGIGTALMGIHAQRSVPLSGTPVCRYLLLVRYSAIYLFCTFLETHKLSCCIRSTTMVRQIWPLR